MTQVYPLSSELSRSDQISVSPDVWESFHNEWESERPIFVRIGGIGGVVCRLRPDTGSVHDICSIPEWVWVQIGAPESEEWISIYQEDIPDAKRLVLRAYMERSITDLEDPVSTLTLALSGADGPSWGCLNKGADISLSCGNFVIVDLLDEEERSVAAACILDIDLELDIVPAVDHQERPSTPIPSPPQERPPTPIPSPPPVRHRNGFVPFSGVGRRLCDSPPRTR
jgi:hypothetical protein